MQKKRYLFIDGQLNGGGAERVLIDILRNFDFENSEVTLLQINAGGTLLDEVPTDVKVVSAWPGYTRLFSIAYRCSQWWGWDYPLRHQMLKAIKELHFDVAISFLEGMPLKMHAMITEVADRNYSWVHCDLDKDRYEVGQFRKGEEIRAYNKMDGVVCVASDTAKAFQRRFPDCTSEVKVIYNPIDVRKVMKLSGLRGVEVSRVEGELSELSAAQVEKGSVEREFKIVVCGRLTAPKKLDRVIRLARRIKDELSGVEGELNELKGVERVEKKLRILLIGSGDLEGELRELTKLSGVEDVVEFLGFQRNPFPFVKAADMLLSTSGYEGFSLVICEAMALGVPVVATKTAGPMEILDNDRYGLLCDHDDESIYQAVKRMYEDEELRRHYSEVGKERVKDFSVERTMASVYDL